MPYRENISYLVPRDPSIQCWQDRVKLSGPRDKNLIQLGLDEFEETMGDKIKVYLRLKSCSVDNAFTILSSTTLQTEAPKESVSYKNVTNGVGKLIHKFTFTSILDHNVTQSELFKTCVIKNLKKFLDGENYLLMAYGTTSAGKTFTMQGNVDQPGVIPRALEFVFSSLKNNIISQCKYLPHQNNEFVVPSEEHLKKDLLHKNFILSLDLTKCQKYPDASHITMQKNSSSGFSDMYENMTFREMQSYLTDTEIVEIDPTSCKYSVWISMVEIYNEQVYDLLEIPNEKAGRSKLIFRDDEYGNTFLKGLRYVNVSSGHEAFQILQFGRSNLHLAPTALNNSSSRSHCIFTITLAKFFNYESSSYATMSRFSFCDLAGIERAKKTLNVKDRLVESKAINTSLSIFVKCFTTIKENQNNKEKKLIPYRESKLTKLFRDAVTGKEQFSLIVNVTTEPNLFDETLNVLKFSAIAQKIIPQNVFVKPKMPRLMKKSRFSQLVTNSCYDSRTIDWDALADDNKKLKEESSTEIEDLKHLVAKLKQELLEERKRCEEIESDIREELTDKFSEILKKQSDSNKICLKNERERLIEMYERKEKRLIKCYEILRKNKRQKFENEVDSFEDEDQEKKLKEAQKEIELLISENSSLKQQIQKLVEEHNIIAVECSTLKFTISEKDRMLKEAKKAMEAKVAGGNALELELRRQLEEAQTKINDYKSLLDEAALDYKELEENNRYLINKNEVLGECLAEQREAVPDLKNELVEVQKMLSHKRLLVEKLEDANEEFNIELNKLKLEDKIKKNFIANTDEKELVNLRLQLKETLEKLSESRIEFETLQSEKSNFEKELRIYQSKIEDMENKILNLEKNLVHNKEVEFKQISAELKEAKSEVMILFKEKNSLQEKCNELNDEITILQKEMKNLVVQSKNDREAANDRELQVNELNEQIKNMEIKEREAKVAVIDLQAKFEATMKNFKESAELQSQQIPQLQEKIKNLEEEIANREKSSAATDEAHQRIIANHQKELNELKEENERLRNEILSANNFVTKSKTPQKSNKIEVLKDYDSPISTSDEKNISAENDSKYSKKIVNMSPQNLNKQMANMCLQQTQSKSTRKKVDLLEETIHPSTIKHTNRRRKKNENGKKEKERETEKKRESESASVKKKGKCYKKLFTDNDFDGLTDLNSSPLEQEIPRLRPRK